MKLCDATITDLCNYKPSLWRAVLVGRSPCHRTWPFPGLQLRRGGASLPSYDVSCTHSYVIRFFRCKNIFVASYIENVRNYFSSVTRM